MDVVFLAMILYLYNRPLQETNISHQTGSLENHRLKKVPFKWDMLVPWRVSFLTYRSCLQSLQVLTYISTSHRTRKSHISLKGNFAFRYISEGTLVLVIYYSEHIYVYSLYSLHDIYIYTQYIED